MITRAQVARWAARPEEYLIVNSPRKCDQPAIYSTRDCRLSRLPRPLEKLPVEWTRGHVESAWVDEHLTAYPRAIGD